MGTDAYEQTYMDAGTIVFREKHVGRIFVGIFLALAALVAGLGVFAMVTALSRGGAGAVPALLIPLSSAAVLTTVALYFAVMRTTVSKTHLAVSWGTIARTIPLSAIRASRIENRIGLGPKFDGRGWN